MRLLRSTSGFHRPQAGVANGPFRVPHPAKSSTTDRRKDWYVDPARARSSYNWKP
jgi:hypothetical protein